MKIEFIKFEEHIIPPRRMYDMDTGADIFMPHAGMVEPGETVVIPLGFGINIPNGYTGRMQVRTSVARKGIIIQGCAIDAGYTGELHMILHNVSKKNFSWSMNDRLGYIEIYPTQYVEFISKEKESLKRENNCFGSTGV